jgi:hypothetical protein
VTSGDNSGAPTGGTSTPPVANLLPDIVAGLQVTASEQRRAALVVAGRATDPDDAHELLGMLGLLDSPRPRPPMSTGSQPGDPITSAEARGSLVDTKTAAAVLGTLESTLDRVADARIVTPARGGPAGSRRWSLPDLRRQIAAYLDDHTEGDDHDEVHDDARPR